MPGLSDTITRLNALRRAGHATSAAGSSRLAPLEDFGSNPGALDAKLYLPPNLPARPALVVVLHGCTQTADGYDHGAGWSAMADRHGFALLLPEQRRANNPNLCFNWFSPADNRRDAGEALSIRQMIAAAVARHGIDEARIFVTGLSAGGAMAGVMLATYPELFAGGAIIAGLPYGCAATVPEAFDRMRGHGMPDAATLAARVRAASDHHGPWPTLSIWHGSGDATVSPFNAAAIVGQWREVHGLAPTPTRRDTVDGHPRQLWCDRAGREVMEEFTIAGMGHGTPLDTAGPDGCGASGPFLLETGISSTRHIVAFWGLAAGAAEAKPATADRAVPALRTIAAERVRSPRAATPKPTPTPSAANGVGKVIEDALRAAGLMR